MFDLVFVEVYLYNELISFCVLCHNMYKLFFFLEVSRFKLTERVRGCFLSMVLTLSQKTKELEHYLSDNYPALILYFSCFCRLAATEGNTTQVRETRLLHHSFLYFLRRLT